VAPGDVVEVVGGATYAGGATFVRAGTSDAKITIRGVSQAGGRPVVANGVTGLTIAADHYVIEGLEIEGATGACLALSGDDVAVTGVSLHDCGGAGVATTGSGAQALAYVEAFASSPDLDLGSARAR